MGGELPGPAVALIPAYEPTSALCGLVNDLVDAGFEAVVVDDGSSLEAAEVFRAVGQMASVLHHETNRGKGQALKTGMEWISDHCSDDTMVVTVDADGQHLLRDIVRVCTAGFTLTGAASLGLDSGLVLGVRIDDSTTPVRSRIGHDLSRAGLRMVTGRSLADTQTGLRAFRVSMIPQMTAIPGSRFEYEMNQLFVLARRGVPFYQIRITTVYDDAGSHYRGLADSVRVGWNLVKCMWSSRRRR